MPANVCTVVVTYNRSALLVEALYALLDQTVLTDIIIVNNASIDDTENVLEKHEFLTHEQIYYQKLDKNLGGAGGFYTGVKWANDQGYDYIWVMDDDAEPAPNALEELLKYKGYAAYTCAIFHGTPSDHARQMVGHRGYFDAKALYPTVVIPLEEKAFEQESIEIDLSSFVGLLFPRTTVEKIGLPNPDFFIHHDDMEYCLRLKSPILQVNSSHIFHKEARTKARPIRTFLWWKKSRIPFENLWIMYYSDRNIIYLAKQYGKMGFYWRFLKRTVLLLKDIIFFDDHKIRRIVFALGAIVDGFRGNFDNDKPKRILYKEKA
jgi:GT2 family glycosyltransferase